MRNLFKAIVGVLMLTMAGLIFSGCGGNGGHSTAMLPPFPAVQKPVVPEAAKIDVDVYWDATYSMQGYATITEGNFYRTLPSELEDIGASFGGSVKFFRFGEKIEPLSGRDHLRFANPDYYDEVITAVHNVVGVADTNHLSVVVTDLFESDSDWSNVTKKLKEKYFSKHQAVAIIGIKNPFNGKIFDVGLNAASFDYDSGANAAKFRPFYLFVMGSDTLVREFVEKWAERHGKSAQTENVCLSESLMRKTADLSNMEIDSGNLMPEEHESVKDKRIKYFRISKRGKEAFLVGDFKYDAGIGSCELDLTKFTLSVQLFEIQPEEEAKDEKKSDDKKNAAKEEEPKPAGRWASVEPSGVMCELIGEEKKYQIKITLSPEFTEAETMPRYLSVSLVPGRNAVKLPAWVRNWSMANVDVAPSEFDGSKTINLNRIIESLKDAVLNTARPSLVDVNMIIDK